MWIERKDGEKVWYEFILDGKRIGIQGTKTFNPLKHSVVEKSCGLNQIHSSIIRYEGDGCGLVGDGLWTDRKGMMIYVETADCLPVIFYNMERMVIGVLHVGWKGTVLRLPEKFLIKMRKDLGIEYSSWVVAFGPSIEPEHYEIGEDVKEIFEEERIGGVFIKEGRYYLDLVEANRREIERYGITEFHLFPEGTYGSDKFYSHRRGDKNKQITGAVLQ